MLRPSYSELMSLLNEENKENDEITSRYTIVMAVAKRARQLINGEEALATSETDKAVSVAVAEMANGKLKVSASTEDESAVNRSKFISVIEAENLDDY